MGGLQLESMGLCRRFALQGTSAPDEKEDLNTATWHFHHEPPILLQSIAKPEYQSGSSTDTTNLGRPYSTRLSSSTWPPPRPFDFYFSSSNEGEVASSVDEELLQPVRSPPSLGVLVASPLHYDTWTWSYLAAFPKAFAYRLRSRLLRSLIIPPEVIRWYPPVGPKSALAPSPRWSIPIYPDHIYVVNGLLHATCDSSEFNRKDHNASLARLLGGSFCWLKLRAPFGCQPHAIIPYHHATMPLSSPSTSLAKPGVLTYDSEASPFLSKASSYRLSLILRQKALESMVSSDRCRTKTWATVVSHPCFVWRVSIHIMLSQKASGVTNVHVNWS
ncbi:hypothetical protein ACRALDRAFT_210551 [Sodiomyces alcalophilus JCM 7366]|uniref:uncharacterized protein n=1 Tax=Sodiomyces alcalophilus JCM 7366 TaxID=591952 RepID=UPI0039B49972